jgi:hypothetical protein
MCMFRLLPAVILLGASLASPGAAVCPATRAVAPGDTVRELAEFYFGDSQYWSSLVLATNSRIGEGFQFISDLNNLKGVPTVCIPDLAEAERWRRRYEKYMAAVAGMGLPEPWEVVQKLVEFPPDQPIQVATWIREAQLGTYRDSGGAWLKQAPGEIWVTVEPYLQKFCTAFVAAHGSDREQLTLRLEQRLGVPPVSNKTTFLEIRLNRPSADVIFRPCMNPATNSTNCPLGPPPGNVSETHKNWIYQQYYSSYGQARLSSFPWTSLGYTFDWAPSAQGDGQFQRFGESEFVIRKGAPLEIVRAVDTAEYCRPN